MEWWLEWIDNTTREDSMISEKKELISDRPKSCGKPAIRVLRYNTRSSSGECELKSKVFCDDQHRSGDEQLAESLADLR
jgi:hypothetical protein